ncbi:MULTISPECIES: MBL fold metallo-hydrolase [unclassified Pseudodesulfovibrio]|uniref:MBL fold metallo-hydrolase RNA specificity domain-containing protein n=1 Tax=unclassified Pseudodesulfovibrio TaxID=2661612 RepID=UPI000FEBE98F|nr:MULTISPECIES: MBL fold metallo-hydrolase [unclassified Pseudodesulfovibrio]MCJ2163691.1 MBL fold metallo-hydrolase [Pseudodesulfovibrio sp. S3-i]RWU06052.1 MBL fold metallo-hydrolase [Pseudodesulfovibrio sp. S3]
MKVTFMGAARTVSGSCYILECGGKRFALDCGLHQGNREIEKRNRNIDQYDPKHIDFILITHAHIDHTGLLPALVAKGYRNPIYCTAPTRDLMEIMLLDSAHIQEMEAEWSNRKQRRVGGQMLSPLYSIVDAENTIPLLATIEYSKTFEPAPGIKVTYMDAGHILGSAFIEIEYEEDGKRTTAVFSGDLGRPEQLLVKDPSDVDYADYLFLESTYGNRNHLDEAGSLDQLAEAIDYSYKNREKVVIPAFAVERSQQIIYSLFLLRKQGRLPADMPVYLDSPLAIRATEIFRKHPEFFDKQTQTLIKNGENPLDLPNLHFTESREQSQAINESSGPAVVISASGMANAGRIKHHLRHNLWKPGASVVFVGWQGVGTPGRKIVNGAKKIRLFGEEVTVNAKVFIINGFSGHAGQDELMDWLGTMQGKPTKVILVHGEAEVQQEFGALITEKYGFEVHIPEYMEELELEPGAALQPVVDMAVARPRVDWQFLLADSERLYTELRNRIKDVESRPWVDQAELRDKLLDINRDIVELVSEM